MFNILKKVDLKNVNWKKAGKYGMCVVSGVLALFTALDDQKRDDEFSDMKERLSKLEGKES